MRSRMVIVVIAAAALVAAAAAPAGLAISASAADTATRVATAAGSGSRLGSAVAISGSTVVVGAPAWDNDRGEVYVYDRHSTRWSQQAVLRLGRGTRHYWFGDAVAISGSTIIVGAFGADENSGRVYVYVRIRSRWHRQAVLAAGRPRRGDRFGLSVGISGSTAIVGAPNRDRAGQALVFVRHRTTWSRPIVLPGPGRSFGPYQFGAAVALSGTLGVAGWPDINSSGTAWVFRRASATTWGQTAYLSPSPVVAYSQFGSSAAVSAAGIVIGAPGADTGTAYLFTWYRHSWHQRLVLRSPGADISFGTSVSGAGPLLLVGSPGIDSKQGAVYLYRHSGTRWRRTTTFAGPSAESQPDSLFGNAVAMSRTTVVIGAPGLAPARGAVYIYGRSGHSWKRQATF
ncbi:MAG TPA: hypothetical protein VMA72_22120 [Streptosporangiaceae bacterium]|nr:hypothetical protein [Streptosporangiaceae bacterium]